MLLEVILVLVMTVLFILLLDEVLKDRRAEKLTKNIPGLPRLPLVGAAHTTFGLTDSERGCLLLDTYKYNKHILKFYTGPRLCLMIFKPEYLQKVLNSKDLLDRNFFVKMMEPYMGEGLSTAVTAMWTKKRKRYSPNFTQLNVNNFFENISAKSATFIEILKRDLPLKKDGQFKDIIGYARNFTTDSFCESYFNYQLNSQERDATDIQEFFEGALDAMASKIFKAYISFFDVIYKRTKLHEDEQKHVKFLEGLLKKMLKKSMDKIKSKSSEDFTDEYSENKKKNLVDLIVESHLVGDLTEKQLLDEAKTFFLTGIDTNATSLCYILLSLALHPEIQEKVYEEVMSVVGPDRNVALSDLPDMKYTECVIKESLRIFPSVPMTFRKAQRDVQLDTDIVIPQGCSVFVNFVGVHRSEENWPDPLKFDPDRFLPENFSQQHPYSWLPFSGGPRNCIGLRYAMNILRIAVPVLVRTFKVTTTYKSVEDVRIEPCISLKALDGFQLYLQVR